MATKGNTNKNSVFGEYGINRTVAALLEEIQSIYLADSFPWIIGYSGGKDSTTALQLIWYALRDLDKAQLTKTVHVICSDTLVETPLIVEHARSSAGPT